MKNISVKKTYESDNYTEIGDQFLTNNGWDGIDIRISDTTGNAKKIADNLIKKINHYDRLMTAYKQLKKTKLMNNNTQDKEGAKSLLDKNLEDAKKHHWDLIANENYKSYMDSFEASALWQKQKDKIVIDKLVDALKDAQANIIEIKSNAAGKVITDSPILKRIKQVLTTIEGELKH